MNDEIELRSRITYALDTAGDPFTRNLRKELVLLFRKCFKEGAEFEHERLMQKMKLWLKANADNYTWYDEMSGESGMRDEFLDDFVKFLESSVEIR